MEERQFLEILVKRFVANELSEKELEAFFHLLAQGKLDNLLNKYLDKESGEILKVEKTSLPKSGLLLLPLNRLSLAASVFLILGMVMFLAKPGIVNFLKIGIVAVETKKGERKEIRLPDGSTVWLNESSKLEYPNKFDSDERKVVLLDGEAYFDIKRDTTKPFNVEASGTNTKVLGTAFNIRSYHFLESVQVTVTRGKVQVEEASDWGEKRQRKILLPNEQVNFDTKTKSIEKTAVNSANAVAWKDGKLLFDNESFANVTAILENKFGVKIAFADESIKSYHMSAEFTATDSLAHILELLSLANNLDYQFEDKKITLLKKRKNNANPLPM